MFSDKVEDNFLKGSSVGLGKFSFKGFGRSLVKGLGKVVRSAVPILGDLICDAIDSQLNEGWELKSGEGSYEPTYTEESVINGFVESKFNPFCVNLTKELDAAMKSYDLKTQVEKINKVLSKICFVQAHFRTNQTNGLSADAVQWRSDYIKSIFTPFLNVIETSLSAKPVVARQMTNVASNLNYLEVASIASVASIPANYTCNHYKVNPGVIMEPAIPAITDPIDGTVTEIPTTPTNAGTSPATEKNFLQKNGFPLALGAVALWALFSKKKKKN